MIMKRLNPEASIYMVSDSLGETGEYIVKAALAQFDAEDTVIQKIPYVKDVAYLKSIIDEASEKEDAVLFYTIVDLDLIDCIKTYTKTKNLEAIDLIGSLIHTIKDVTKLEPIKEPGIIRRMDEEYFRRIEAIEFAVKYDDGQDPSGVLLADLVILGISRTSKTPLSMFLANKNIKVCNIPLVPESKPPKEIYEVPARRIVGLTNSPLEIIEIREERLRALGLPKGSSYAKMERILEEIDFAERIMKNIGCPIIDMTNKAVEDTAEVIISLLKKYNERFDFI